MAPDHAYLICSSSAQTLHAHRQLNKNAAGLTAGSFFVSMNRDGRAITRGRVFTPSFAKKTRPFGWPARGPDGYLSRLLPKRPVHLADPLCPGRVFTPSFAKKTRHSDRSTRGPDGYLPPLLPKRPVHLR